MEEGLIRKIVAYLLDSQNRRQQNRREETSQTSQRITDLKRGIESSTFSTMFSSYIIRDEDLFMKIVSKV